MVKFELERAVLQSQRSNSVEQSTDRFYQLIVWWKSIYQQPYKKEFHEKFEEPVLKDFEEEVLLHSKLSWSNSKQLNCE